MHHSHQQQRDRRARLIAEMRAQSGGGLAAIPTAPEAIRNADTHYPYRYDSHFYYLTGFAEPEAVLVIVAGAQPKSLLFCREKNEECETWDGFRFGPKGAQERFGFDEAYPIAELDARLATLLSDQPALHFPVGADPAWDARAMGWLNAVRCMRMELGEADTSGRRRPVPVQGSEFDIPLSVAVIAIGTGANPLIQSTTPGLNTNKRNYIEADAMTQRAGFGPIPNGILALIGVCGGIYLRYQLFAHYRADDAIVTIAMAIAGAFVLLLVLILAKSRFL